MVSAISNVTDTRLASKAPPDSETIREITYTVVPSSETFTAQVQVPAAINSCKSATRLGEQDCTHL